MSDDSPSLYLITPRLAEAAAFAPALEAALDAGVIACVLVLLEARDEGEAKKIVRTLAQLVQDRGAALLVEDDVQVSLRAGADGAHVRATDEVGHAALADAVKKLKPSGIAGAGGLKTRHDAMSAGELDIDYVMFGEPARDGYTPPFPGTLERVGWWAEIFNVPVVGYASELGQVEELAGTGADFIALGTAVWDDPRGPASAVRDAMAAIARSRIPVE